MSCKGCVYLGMIFEHLKGHENYDDWRDCKYPLPFHVTPCATRMDVKHDCKVKVLDKTDLIVLKEIQCKECTELVKPVRVKGINLDGYACPICAIILAKVK